ncbi:PEP-CTERM sorting domain-containing protein [Ideonella livida]|uniref:PEP-CTERM sorting domain-containing protein n=1 Tax=Ideonella livida TaxID=2707176 RepID=A0A7C9TP68_9BURK|nr:PEP-CTERM sorting domain-containing protein [Ideonella livida]NDY93366.1 PEP-CTERM sorting domain-containing protein [Ideonella livida]
MAKTLWSFVGIGILAGQAAVPASATVVTGTNFSAGSMFYGTAFVPPGGNSGWDVPVYSQDFIPATDPPAGENPPAIILGFANADGGLGYGSRGVLGWSGNVLGRGLAFAGQTVGATTPLAETPYAKFDYVNGQGVETTNLVLDGQTHQFSAFAFDLYDAPNTFHEVYGWVEFTVAARGPEPTDLYGVTLLRWAYEDSGSEITVGLASASAVPEPATWSLALMGLAALGRRHKPRSSRRKA